MSIELLYYLAEIVAAIAFVVSLIYVARQIGQNTAAMQAAGRTSSTMADIANLFETVRDPNVHLCMTKPELSDEEKVQLSSYMIAFFRLREHDWLQYQNGALDEATWNTYISSIQAMLAYQRSRDWWSNHEWFDPSFRLQVDNSIAGTPVVERHQFVTLFD